MAGQSHNETSAPVSVLLHPLAVGSAPVLWRDWSRRHHRRACMHLLRQQQVAVQTEQRPSVCSTPTHLSRAQRAHSRLDWPERLARNARGSTAKQVTVKPIACSRKRCSLARVGDGLTASQESWEFPQLGQACFSEESFMAFLASSSSRSPISSLFCSSSFCCCSLLLTSPSVLHRFRSSNQDKLFNFSLRTSWDTHLHG